MAVGLHLMMLKMVLFLKIYEVNLIKTPQHLITTKTLPHLTEKAIYTGSIKQSEKPLDKSASLKLFNYALIILKAEVIGN